MASTRKLSVLGSCKICKRQARGFLYIPQRGHLKKPAQFCSIKCMDNYMIDKSPNEKVALNEASAAAGAFIEATGNYDFTKFTPDQFDEFIEAIVTAYVDSLQAQRVDTEGVRFP